MGKVNIEYVLSLVLRYVELDNIIFVNSNMGDGFDLDIYCVVNSGKSRTYCFFEGNQWIEVFIDHIQNTEYKVLTTDILGINFITMLPYQFGNKETYLEIFDKAIMKKVEFTLNEIDISLFTYRVRITQAKIHSSDDDFTRRMLFANIINPLIQIIMEKYNVFPESPKNWLRNLKSAMGSKFDEILILFDGKYDFQKIDVLIDKYCQNMLPIELAYEGKNRRSSIS
jgi:hypothetical protein